MVDKVRDLWAGLQSHSIPFIEFVESYRLWIHDVAHSFGLPKSITSVTSAVAPTAGVTFIGGPLAGIALGVSQLATAGIAEYNRYRIMRNQMDAYRDLQILMAVQQTVCLLVTIFIMAMFRRALGSLCCRLNLAQLFQSLLSYVRHRFAKEGNTDVHASTGDTAENASKVD